MSRRDQLREPFRGTFKGGRIQMSRDFYELPAEVKGKIFCRIANYTAFDADGYHDAGLIIFGDWAVKWMIEDRADGLVLDISLGGFNRHFLPYITLTGPLTTGLFFCAVQLIADG